MLSSSIFPLYFSISTALPHLSTCSSLCCVWVVPSPRPGSLQQQLSLAVFWHELVCPQQQQINLVLFSHEPVFGLGACTVENDAYEKISGQVEKQIAQLRQVLEAAESKLQERPAPC